MGSDPYDTIWREHDDCDNDMWQDEESYYTEETLDRDE
jgi:hypothetical protein